MYGSNRGQCTGAVARFGRVLRGQVVLGSKNFCRGIDPRETRDRERSEETCVCNAELLSMLHHCLQSNTDDPFAARKVRGSRRRSGTWSPCKTTTRGGNPFLARWKQRNHRAMIKRGWSREPQSAGAPKLTEFRVKFESATLRGRSGRASPSPSPSPRATGVTLSDESRYARGERRLSRLVQG